METIKFNLINDWNKQIDHLSEESKVTKVGTDETSWYRYAIPVDKKDVIEYYTGTEWVPLWAIKKLPKEFIICTKRNGMIHVEKLITEPMTAIELRKI